MPLGMVMLPNSCGMRFLFDLLTNSKSSPSSQVKFFRNDDQCDNSLTGIEVVSYLLPRMATLNLLVEHNTLQCRLEVSKRVYYFRKY